jgi:hypothetical protein
MVTTYDGSFLNEIDQDTRDAVERIWHQKLYAIGRHIIAAKSGLAKSTLSKRETVLAARLILEIERRVNDLGQSAEQIPASIPTEWIPSWAQIDDQLDDLNLLCRQLLTAVDSPRP